MFRYKEVVAAMKSVTSEDEIFDQLIRENEISLKDEEVLDAENYLYQEWLYHARLNELAGGEMVFLTPEAVIKIKNDLHEKAVRNLKIEWILDQVIEGEETKVCKEEIEKEISDIALREGMTIERVCEFISKTALIEDLKYRKAEQFLFSLADKI